jgi:hypothetical protein
MKSNRWVKLSAAAAIAASVAGVALAQGGPGRMMEERGGGMMGWGMRGGDGPGWGMAAGPGAADPTGCSTVSRAGSPS